MRLRILGSLSIDDETPFGLSATRREGRILCALLLSANRPVPTGKLIEMLWNERPPATARQQLQNCAAALNRSLRHRLDSTGVDRTQAGYVIRVPCEDLDASLFDHTVRTARRLVAERRVEEAVDAFRLGLRLWRGDVLEGVDLGPFHPLAVRLSELRLAVIEECAAIELRLGRHRAVIAELTSAVQANPYREELVGLLMEALAACGQVTAALDLFRFTRERLVADYGLEPGPLLQTRHSRILRGDRETVHRPEAGLADRTELLTAALAQLDHVRAQLFIALHGIPRSPSGQRSTTEPGRTVA
ncbi:AfsR/SARP family transcriptional regulator [Dactylosporangium sp. CA-092794]|uniref:AfsR/SARP family transcriptional regulator n=1 Tax=Dactylosporangium sp. CA-092794 TaxID=3239929 RepID=UPI003D932F91